jgi:hypothetical protein
MTRTVLVVAYLITIVVAAISLDADGGGWLPVLWLLASALLGAGTGDFRFAALALLAIPIAIPFGLPTDRSSDPVLPVWVAAAYLAAFSAALIVLSAAGRRIVEPRLRRRRTARGSGIG